MGKTPIYPAAAEHLLTASGRHSLSVRSPSVASPSHHKEVTMATRRFKSATMKFGVPLSVPGSRYVMLDAKA